MGASIFYTGERGDLPWPCDDCNPCEAHNRCTTRSFGAFIETIRGYRYAQRADAEHAVPEPEGLPAISRGSRAQPDTPGRMRINPCTPKGVPAGGSIAMSTYLSLHYHLVFSTKRREPRIADAWIERFHEYLGGTVKGLGGFAQGIRGVADHVHLLVGLKATHCLSDFMRELKKGSSVWVHETIGDSVFAWQDGYAAFTVSATSRNGVRSYIANQAEHHRSTSFRDELIELLRLADVEYDERYLD